MSTVKAVTVTAVTTIAAVIAVTTAIALTVTAVTTVAALTVTTIKAMTTVTAVTIVTAVTKVRTVTSVTVHRLPGIIRQPNLFPLELFIPIPVAASPPHSLERTNTCMYVNGAALIGSERACETDALTGSSDQACLSAASWSLVCGGGWQR